MPGLVTPPPPGNCYRAVDFIQNIFDIVYFLMLRSLVAVAIRCDARHPSEKFRKAKFPMLIVRAKNITPGREICDYKVFVSLNDRTISEFVVTGHRRGDGFAELIRKIAEEAKESEASKSWGEKGQ